VIQVPAAVLLPVGMDGRRGRLSEGCNTRCRRRRDVCCPGCVASLCVVCAGRDGVPEKVSPTPLWHWRRLVPATCCPAVLRRCTDTVRGAGLRHPRPTSWGGRWRSGGRLNLWQGCESSHGGQMRRRIVCRSVPTLTPLRDFAGGVLQVPRRVCPGSGAFWRLNLSWERACKSARRA